MHLIEVLVAGSVFAASSSSALQIWSATAVQAEQLQDRQQLELRIEQDRLQLQASWRSATASGQSDGCTQSGADLSARAVLTPPPPGLQRRVEPTSDGAGVLVRWSVPGATQPQRQRLVTPAGLGLCTLAPAASAPGTPEELAL